MFVLTQGTDQGGNPMCGQELEAGVSPACAVTPSSSNTLSSDVGTLTLSSPTGHQR